MELAKATCALVNMFDVELTLITSDVCLALISEVVVREPSQF